MNWIYRIQGSIAGEYKVNQGILQCRAVLNRNPPCIEEGRCYFRISGKPFPVLVVELFQWQTF